ncbi:receptor-like protein EIX2 [Gossypium arboreum]|uniref:receptor-like protein EIX2 n=1 Tax=Gossypium arboreum TaxID=29729 RepID=UPI0022F1BC45|nr:receptor-like protein EIX2 [Gossypium arboreum]
MMAIQELYLSDNLFILAENQVRGDSGLNEIGKLLDLRVLDLGYNLLNGSISKSLGQLSILQVLRLAGNCFDGDVISEAHFSNFTNLQELDLSYTYLNLKFNTGWIPPFPLRISDFLPYWFWDKFQGLSYINMSFNQISGTFPNNSVHIIHLDLSSNNFSGPLPRFSLDFMEMGTINLSKNKFTCPVSPICNITGEGFLALFDLSNNLFSGVVPDCFGSFPFLTALNLGDNNFSGSLPRSLGSLISLEMLSLRGNKFSGVLPSSLQNCAKLKFLDLSDNELSGEIPMWIGQKLSSLVFLSLQRNQFKGRIPHQLCGLKYLHILDLSVNKISGTIPSCLNNFTSMTKKASLDRMIEHHILDSGPKLVFNVGLYGGPLPIIQVRYVDEALLTWKGTKQSYPQLGLLLAIDLSCNKLTGEIPEELSSLRELVALNLSRNLFNGKILQKIGHIRQLEVLDLSRNKFSGNIPTSLSELTFLSTLDLSYNDLSGKIPTSTQLQSFDPSSFSHNRGLCGPPVSPNCSMVEPSPGKPAVGAEEDSDEFMKWFYTGMGLGFAVGFWGFCSVVFFKRSWRHSYYRYLDNAKDWVYVTFVLLKASLLFQEKCTYASACKESERKALLEFKHSLQAMGFSSDNASSSWISEECYLWVGVYCNSFTGYVEMLDFSYQSLVVAEVDISFTNMSNANDWSLIINHLPLLQKLNLRDCDLPSTPSSSVSLTNSSTSLNTLDFSDNNLLSSAIYPWLFTVTSNLVLLDLSTKNQARGDSVLNKIKKLPDFRVLDLGYNLLNGSISKSIGQLSNLKVLRLPRNSFGGDVIFEAHFLNFSYLQKLDLSYTSLTLKFNSGWILPFQASQLLLCSYKLGPRFPNWIQTQMDVLNSDVDISSIVYLDISALGISDSLPYRFWDKC